MCACVFIVCVCVWLCACACECVSGYVRVYRLVCSCVIDCAIDCLIDWLSVWASALPFHGDSFYSCLCSTFFASLFHFFATKVSVNHTLKRHRRREGGGRGKRDGSLKAHKFLFVVGNDAATVALERVFDRKFKIVNDWIWQGRQRWNGVRSIIDFSTYLVLRKSIWTRHFATINVGIFIQSHHRRRRWWRQRGDILILVF